MSNFSSPSSHLSYDLDDETSSQAFFARVSSADCDNFVVLLNHGAAFAGVDLTRDDVRQLGEDGKLGTATRWIHFWSSPNQRSIVEDLASKYEISPRLQSLICPRTPAPSPPQRQDSPQVSFRARIRGNTFKKTKPNDVEKTVEKVGQTAASASPPKSRDLSFYDIVNNIWHFHSVDWGRRFVHIGANVLSVIPGVQRDPMSDKPTGQRLWTSILLCDDGTVISSFERPPYHDSEDMRKVTNTVAKRHILNILKSIPRVSSGQSLAETELMSVNFRPAPPKPSTTSNSMSQSERMECASLLFYYLFDDWMTTYALIAQREHPYRQSLETVRQALSDAASVELLTNLHSLGRQLTVLQLMYQSYGTVIMRLLNRYQRTTYTATNLNDVNNTAPFNLNSSSSGSTPQPGLSPYQPTNLHSSQDHINSFSSTAPTIQLSFLAMGRFERLLDRVNLYALSEINHCLAEKEALVLMTFNTLALSESHSVEKLTRTTILLAKATILFLPVSLMTAYFSLSVGNIETLYTLQTYWFSFLVVIIVSIMFLYIFGLATGTVEGKLVYKSIHRALWDRSVAAILRKTKRH